MREVELAVVRRVSIEPFIILCVSEETMEAWPTTALGAWNYLYLSLIRTKLTGTEDYLLPNCSCYGAPEAPMASSSKVHRVPPHLSAFSGPFVNQSDSLFAAASGTGSTQPHAISVLFHCARRNKEDEARICRLWYCLWWAPSRL